MKKNAVLTVIAGAILLSGQSVAQGLSSDELSYQRTQDRLQRLEKDMNILEQQVYKGKKSSGGGGGGGSTPQIDARIAELEEQMRNLSGSFEEIQFNIKNITKRLDKISEDVDFRISEMEKKRNDEKVSEASIPFAPEDNAAVVTDNKPVIAVEEKMAAPAVMKDDAASQYDRAFKYLREAKYPEAEKALSQFIENNQGNDLVGNAYYWLGETYYVRQNYSQAAVKFLKGYKDFPKGNKAADNLLKLAMSLGKLDKKSEACTTFDKLSSEYPNMDNSIKDKLKAERANFKC